MDKFKNRNRRFTSWGKKSQGYDFECDTCDFAFLQKNLQLKNAKDINEVYKITDKLGAGTFGTVRKGTHVETGLTRAIKNIFKGRTSKSEERMLANEMSILTEVSHVNILSLIEYFETDTRIYIVTDVYEGGELFDEIIARHEFTEKDAAIVVYQLLSCLSYLKRKNIVHRDIKPENILLERSKDLAAIKLIDFGHATHYDATKDEPMKERLGTPYYMAPEILKSRSERAYNHLIDVWSVGVITYILLSGSPPFGGSDNDEIFENVLQGEYSFEFDPWPQVSDISINFVKRIMKYKPEEREEASVLLKDKFFDFKTKFIPKLVKKSKRERKTESTEVAAVGSPSRSTRKANRASKSFQKLSRAVSVQVSRSFDNLKKRKARKSIKKEQSKAIKNLKNFKCKQRLAQVVHTYVVTQCMPKKDREDLAKVFRSWDTNGDGVLSREEMKTGIKKTSPRVAKTFDLDHWFDLMDQDGNGYIEYQEFLMMATNVNLMSRTNLIAVFNFLDKDGSGYLEVDELEGALVSVENKDETVRQMLKEADKNNDGRISKEEFLLLLSTK